MKSITSLAVTSRLCGIFVDSDAAWKRFGEPAWSDMMVALRKQPPHLQVMGIDSEWFRNSPLAVVQLATSSHCFVLHLSYFAERRLPESVKTALSDPSIIKCGVGVSGDVSRLQKEQSILIQSVLDVAQYSVALHLHEGPQSNLKVLAASVADLDIEKNKYVTRSNWELELSPNQINYAAEDALASFLVGEVIMRKAFEVYKMDSPNFDIPAWLKRSAVTAAQELKRTQRESAKQANEQMKQEKRVDSGAAGAKSNPLAAQVNGGSRVAVLDKSGSFLFECSPGRAKFYVMEKGLAKITKHVKGNTHKALEIQLLFDPKVKTRLCMYNALGACELQDHCPFAHGVDELQPESRALLTSTEPSCACCLGTKSLLRHAVTPPSFRKYLPFPYRQPHDDDFEPVCGQCNSVLRHYYDAEMSNCYIEAAALNKEMLDISIVAKCISYARLLLDHEKLKKLPSAREAELKNYIREHWEKTYFREFNPDIVIHEPLQLDETFLMGLKRIVPGDVRSKVTVNILVGNSQVKAAAFTQRWRKYCFETCGMIEKDSNHMTFEDWKSYRNQNGISQDDAAEGTDEVDAAEVEA